MTDKGLLIGKGEKETKLLTQMANRHGLISGATGTGKTVTLKVMAEHFSSIGVPVFISDVKGDVASLSEEGSMNDKIQERLDFLKVDDFEFSKFPVRLWDVYGEQGHPLRVTMSEMGPMLLARILDLNETQEGVLSIIFRLADEMEMLLIDIKDLRSLLIYVGENAKEISLKYGNVTSQSIAAIQRSLLRLEDEGGDLFFAEPDLDVEDFLVQDSTGKGMINILVAEKLFNQPSLYSTFLLWLLSDLFESLPEVGDLEKPKLVFFFDEAHLLFDKTPKYLMEKIEQVVRLIRSKGVGIFFVTQNPIDIPDRVLGQLGNRVQHALRAYTPRDQKAVKSAAETFRENLDFNVADVISELKTGQALVSFLDEEGVPSIVEKATILPPKSKIGTISLEQRLFLINSSSVFQKYHQTVDRESAYEILEMEKAAEIEAKEKLARDEEASKTALTEEKARILADKEAAREEKEQARLKAAHERSKTRERKKNPLNKVARTTMNTLTGDIGRKIARGLLGNISDKF